MENTRSLLRSLLMAGIALSVFVSQVEASIIIRYPVAPGYEFSSFGLTPGRFVREYRNLDGSAGGAVVPFTMDVFDNDPDPAEKDPLVNGMEKIGTLNFQFILWRGSSAGAAGAIDQVGAGIFGGFNLTDLNDAGTRFSFLQTFTDNDFPNGKVDGGGFRGKFNGDIGGYNGTPNGWNYQGTQYDYIDNPFDNFSARGRETISFETALVCYTDNKQVHILADFTWGFTSNGTGGVTGVSPTAQTAASNSLFSLYTNKLDPPGPTPAGDTPTLLQNIGAGGCHDFASVVQPPLPVPTDIPEPSSYFLLIVGLAGLLATEWQLRKRGR